MKKLFYILIFFCFVLSLNAQINLVPNGSFEQVDSCYDYQLGVVGIAGYINSSGWISGKASPDFFASCNISPNNPNGGFFGTPKNRFGIQKPNHGLNYAGLFNYVYTSNGLYTEYLTIKLSDSLQVGQKYFFSMYISLADSFNCATNNLGVLFTKINPQYNSIYNTYWNKSTLKFIQKITDTTNWVQLKGSFIADSNYKTIYVGNFYNYPLTDTILYTNRPLTTLQGASDGNQNHCHSYYYVDNLKLSTDSLFTITSLNENKNNTPVTIYPNPTSGQIFLKNHTDINKIELYDCFGNILLNKTLDSDNIVLYRFPEGIYFIRIIFKNNFQSTHKLIKIQ